MASSFPALRGRMGDLDYYVTVMKLGELVKQVGYAEELQNWDAGIPSELKKQRKLNMSRVVNEMVPYLTATPDHFYSALTAEVERPGEHANQIRFDAAPDAGAFWGGLLGTVTFDGSEQVMVLDGQHRLRSIERALREQPDLARESIAVILVPGRGHCRTQQLFTDLNRYAKQPSKTLNLLFEHREFFARVAKEAGDRARSLKDRVNLETNSLGRKSRHHITLAVLYECVVALLEGHYDDSEVDPARCGEAVSAVVRLYDDVVSASLPDFHKMLAGVVTPYDLRCKYIYGHSVGQQAIARAVRACQDAHGRAWEEIVGTGFRRIDWRIANPEWEGSAVQGGTIYTRRQNIQRTATFLKLKLGIDVPAHERQALVAAITEIEAARQLPGPVVQGPAACACETDD